MFQVDLAHGCTHFSNYPFFFHHITHTVSCFNSTFKISDTFSESQPLSTTKTCYYVCGILLYQITVKACSFFTHICRTFFDEMGISGTLEISTTI